jgi:hypothetical protein
MEINLSFVLKFYKLKKKTRFEFENSPHIKVAYGSDSVNGVFLSVFDDRLEYDDKASDEVNAITEKVGVKDGGGSYFDLHTRENGYGFQVSNEAMRVFLYRYGVPEDKINSIFKEASIMAENCKGCNLVEGVVQMRSILPDKRCAKCKTKRYCSRECQTKDWPIHKYICDSLPFPPKSQSPSKHVYCFYLPENGKKVNVIQVEIERCFDETKKAYFDEPLLDDYIGKSNKAYMTLKKSESMYSVPLVIIHMCMNQADVSNELVKKLTVSKSVFNWKGSLIVMKINSPTTSDLLSFVDVDLTDYKKMVDLLCDADGQASITIHPVIKSISR